MANEMQKMREGNQMKMHEALVIAMKAICNHARANHTCASLAWENSTINANCGDILCAHRDLCEAKNAIQKALSAPARNCDLPNPEERFTEFCSRYQSCSTCPHNRTLNGLRCDGKWLLATAEKGGAK